MASDRAPRGVAQGGFWQPAQGQYSPQTRDLLKVMMEESKLTNLQQRKINDSLSKGQSLPSREPPRPPAKRQPQSQKGKPLNPRNYSSRLRTREQIEQSGAYDKPVYRPARPAPRSSAQEKQRLANLMAFGSELEPSSSKKNARPITPPSPPPEVDRFDELINEIEERRNFLAKLEDLGSADKYRSKIETEISQMIREMEVIDKRRTAELKRLEANLE